MPTLSIRYRSDLGVTLGYSIERLLDKRFFDPTTSTFSATVPTNPVAALNAGTGIYANVYSADLTGTPTVFSPGDYAVYIHNTSGGVNTVLDACKATVGLGPFGAAYSGFADFH